MMSQKRTHTQLSSMPFIGLWMLAHIVAWWVIYAVSEEMSVLNSYPDWVAATVFGIIMAIIVPITQKALIRRKLGVQLRGWLRLSAVGWIVGMISIIIIPEVLEDIVSGDPIWTYVIGAFTLPAIAQWLILRRVVRGAWVWMIAGLASAFAFSAILENSPYSSDFFPYWVIATATQGAVTGISLLWIFHQNRPTAKAKS